LPFKLICSVGSETEENETDGELSKFVKKYLSKTKKYFSSKSKASDDNSNQLDLPMVSVSHVPRESAIMIGSHIFNNVITKVRGFYADAQASLKQLEQNMVKCVKEKTRQDAEMISDFMKILGMGAAALISEDDRNNLSGREITEIVAKKHSIDREEKDRCEETVQYRN
jgi:hypothetical protein